MPERAPIRASGKVVAVVTEDRLFQVEMANGYVAYAILEKKGPRPPASPVIGREITVDFSPFDMSRCKIVSWDPIAAPAS